MTDSGDEDETPVHRRETLRAVLGLLDNEEFDGADDDDAVDDILADMADGINLDDSDEADGADDDPLDADASAADSAEAAPTRADAAGGSAAYVHAALERQTHLDALRRAFGFPPNLRLDAVDIETAPSPYAWLLDSRHANVMSETGRVHAAIRRAIDPTTSSVPPAMGGGNTYEVSTARRCGARAKRARQVPGAIEAIRLPRWVCVAPKLRASNTVSTVHIGCEPNQERLATNYTSTTFNPNSFAAIKMRRTATGLFFRSGSAVVAGARGQLASSNACIEFVRQLQRMHPMPFEPTCKLQNIVVNARCFPIDLDLLAQRYSVHARYEITRFPGLVFRFGHGRAWVFIIFPSGNVIATGFSSWVEANLVFRWLFAHVLCEFKDSKAAARETAAEKKNRAFNNDAAFAVAMRAITRVGLKRSYDAMLRAEARAAGIDTLDLAATWRAIAALPSSND